LLFEKLATLDIIYAIISKHIPGILLELYLSNTIVLIITTFTISYLKYVYSPKILKWLKTVRIMEKEAKKDEFVSKLKKAFSFCFGFKPIFVAVVIYFVRFFIITFYLERNIIMSLIYSYNLYSLFINDFLTIIMIQLSIWYLFFLNAATHYVAKIPIKVDTITDYYEAYGKLTNQLTQLTVLFGLNIGYYSGAIIRWATLTHHYFWLTFFMTLIVFGVMLFFTLGFSGVYKGLKASKDLKLKEIENRIKILKSMYPVLFSSPTDNSFHALESIPPNVILFSEKLERELFLHMQVDESRLIGISNIANLIISIMVSISTSYIQLFLSI